VTYEEFIRSVQTRADLEWEPAVRAARVTLETLARRIARGEAQDLAARLPPELGPSVWTDEEAEPFDVEEFIRRVARREGVDLATAERHAQATFAALWQAVGAEEIGDVAAELSADYARLMPTGPAIEVEELDKFVKRVAQHGALDPEDAKRATDAVLETLGERISGGEVEDLIAQLPVELHASLKRGNAASGGKATRMSLEDFVRRVAECEGVDPERALDRTRAVFAALREALPDKELRDVDAQLPAEYDVLFA
jgi:uncharacterized protein (DUF2267 family)